MRRLGWVPVLLVAIAAASPALAQNNKFKVFVAAAYVSPTGDNPVEISTIIDDIVATDELGFDVGFEWRFSKLFGLEIDYLNAGHEVEFGGLAIAELDLEAASVTLDFHMIHIKVVDFWIGFIVSSARCNQRPSRSTFGVLKCVSKERPVDRQYACTDQEDDVLERSSCRGTQRFRNINAWLGTSENIRIIHRSNNHIERDDKKDLEGGDQRMPGCEQRNY